MKTNTIILAVAVSLLLLCNSGPASAQSGHKLGLQGGWFSLELDYESPQGIYADLGSPWIVLLQRNSLPLHLRGGYRFGKDLGWQVRLGLRFTFLYDFDGQATFFGGWSDGPDVDYCWMLGPEVDFRYAFPCGFRAGLQMPLFAIGRNEENEEFNLFAPSNIMFFQLYIGYSWGL